MKRKLEQFKLDKDLVLLIQKAADDVVTQSEIMTRAACPRKWLYRYVLKLERRALPNYHLIYGTMIHAALANLYKSGHYNETPKEYPIEVPKITIPETMLLEPGAREEIDLVRAKAQIAFDAYRVHYHVEDSYMRVVSTEQDYEFIWKGIKLQGRIDLVACPKIRGTEYIWDWKTAGRFDASMLDAWSFRFQFLFYCWLYWKCSGRKPAGIMANGLAKTALRPKIVDKKTGTKESKIEYLARVKKDMQENREKHFYRQRMPLISGMLERFENEMLGPHINIFSMLQHSKEFPPIICKSLSMPMNTGHCHVYNSFCEYLPLCKDGPIMLAEYDKREAKHIELLQTESEIGES